MTKNKIILSCGLGVDSTALAILCRSINLIPDAIIFADTGGEKPETYHFKNIFEQWLIENNMPSLITVKGKRTRNGKEVNSLEEHCLAGNKLPDIAYGYKGCSLDWKRDPVHKWVNQNFPKEQITYLISYNADEQRRMKVSEKANIVYSYPLIEKQWGRIKCLEAIAKSGLPIPCKSACFFCPSSKKHEILLLAKEHPDLAQRAVNLEENSKSTNTDIKGLGRQYAWKDLITADKGQLSLFDESTMFDCNCLEHGVTIQQYWKQFEN